MATDIRTVRLAAQSSALFKLHGSTNWFAPDGEQLMVMGGNKPSLIQRYPVLQWFGRQFSGMLSQPGARLTVIGYGFGDFHINQTMVEAWQKSQFPMLILHPQGKDVLRMVNRTYGKPLYCPDLLEEMTTYESTRSLSEIFGGNDPAEHGSMIEFLKG